MITFKEDMTAWTDFDVAMHKFSCHLGMAEPEEWFEKKWIYNSSNTIGNMLTRVLFELIDAGIIEKNEDMQLRWKDA